MEASLAILRLIYRDEDPLWLDLVATMAKKIADDRIARGAGEKPVLKKYDPNAPNLPNISIESPSAKKNEVECIDLD